MIETQNEPLYYTPEDTLTISSRFRLSKSRVIGAIKKGIKNTFEKGKHLKTFVSMYGEGLKQNESREFHIVFHRKVSQEEKENIIKAVVDVGRKNRWVREDVRDDVLVRWKVHNTNGYLEKHTNKWYWERIC